MDWDLITERNIQLFYSISRISGTAFSNKYVLAARTI